MATASDLTFSAYVFATQQAVNAAAVTDATHLRDRHGNHVVAKPGDYVLKDEDGGLRVMPGTLFEAEYSAQAAPTAPSSLTQAAQTAASIDLSWTVGSATSLPKIYRDGVLIHTNAANDGTYTDNDAALEANTAYDYTVTNVLNEKPSATSATATLYTAPADITAAPTLHAGGQAATSIQIDFVPVDATAETEVYVDDGAGGAFSLFETVAAGVATSTITGLTTATTYRFKVRPVGATSSIAAENYSSILSQATS